MKKESIKIIGAIIICIITISILSNFVSGVSMTKESLETNLKAYTDGSKKATATLESGTVTIGESGGTVTVDDSTIKISAEGTEITINYSISDSETKFSMGQSFTKDMSDENYLLESLKTTAILPMCFLAVTDAQSVDSNAALTYYMEAVTAGTTTPSGDGSDKLATAKGTKISVDNDIFTYAQTEDSNTDTEYKVTNTLTVKMNADFTTISGSNNSGGNLISAGGNETNSGNAIPILNTTETENEVNEANEIGNEIFDQNNTADDDIPDAGPEDWIQIAIVLVSLVIIFIMLMNIMTTKKMKKQ